ncbi:CLUMA_CG018391, isoform A [Clunio marinus]|uniref:CLUMA_CG018391, isoform A n=1 Tax=Clunio marinus TaxID=568069 RepID=A0A1J1IYU0_9DIPT|nr:CLUMA_CG018391, isoform A [Clunio marinus]
MIDNNYKIHSRVTLMQYLPQKQTITTTCRKYSGHFFYGNHKRFSHEIFNVKRRSFILYLNVYFNAIAKTDFLLEKMNELIE